MKRPFMFLLAVCWGLAPTACGPSDQGGEPSLFDAEADAGPEDDGSTGDPPVNFCTELADGTHCDGDDLVQCLEGEEASRVTCSRGCDASLDSGSQACQPPDPAFCQGKLDGDWCDGNDLVHCENELVESWETCVNGCTVMPVGENDECAVVPFCTTIPPAAEPDPPTTSCNYMDWNLSADGFYLISQFGTSNDSTTWGHGTSCGYLQGHYDYWDCRYDVQVSTCLDNNYQIPHIQGHVDYDYQTVIDTVDQYQPNSVPVPEYFYVACGQRFNCGALLRVSNPKNSRCVVVYTEDGGPGATYEGPDYGGRRILDSSPAVVRFLGVTHIGWANSDLVYVEWGLAGDVPGQACTPCQSTGAAAGTEAQRTPWDINHMQTGLDCR